jgi:hypothetical protein
VGTYDPWALVGSKPLVGRSACAKLRAIAPMQRHL